MENSSYEQQIRLLNDLRGQLTALSRSVDTSHDNYLNQIRSAAGAGFMTNYTSVLEDRFRTFSALIDNLHAEIKRSQKEIDTQEQDVEDLKRNSPNG